MGDLYYTEDQLPDKITRYEGSIEYVGGEWASCHPAARETADGGFAVMNAAGDWHFFAPGLDQVQDIVPKALITAIHMCVLRRK